MSSTEIYAVKQGEELIFLGECRNAWRGAMYVWNDIAKKYFNLDSFPFFGEMQSRVWNANDEHDISNSEHLVLLTTMDNAMVKKEDVEKLILAFNEYGENHKNSSLLEQALILSEKINLIPDGYLVSWIQTTVVGGWFRVINEESEEWECDLSSGFDVFDYFDGDDNE